MNKRVISIIAVIAVIVLAIAGGIFLSRYNKAMKAEQERKEALIDSVRTALEDQYFPIEGRGNAIEFVGHRRLMILFLDGTIDEIMAEGSMYYGYDLYYISDNEFTLVAKLDKAGSSHKEDYSFVCKLTIDDGNYILSDLETDDPYPKFSTSAMLGPDERDQISKREDEINDQAFQITWQRLYGDSGSSGSGSSSGSSSSGSGSSSGGYNSQDEIDPSDYDIELYYLDYEEDFENEEDAWDDFMDDPDVWDDY